MINLKGIHERKVIALLAFCILMPLYVNAQDTVDFSTTDLGQTKAITQWGADTAWPSTDNMRQCIGHMGVDEIDVIRLNFYTDEALVAGEIGANSKSRINTQLSIAAMAGDKPLALTPSSGEATNPWYLNGPDEVWPDRWVQLLEATQEYINKPIAEIEPFNEPDFWDGQGTPQNLYDILVLLQASPNFPGTELMAASTLNSDVATWWYNQVAGPTTHGTTHQLAGSANSYVNFIQHVQANSDYAYNPELHSMAEVIYGAEYGLEGGIWWGPVMRSRGLFVRACQGKQLGYAENRGNYSAAAVYRAPDGELYGFASCFERQGYLTPYRLVCTDRDVYFNGIGPIREFMLNVTTNYDLFVEIDYDTAIFPALDGNRWKIVNRQTGKVLEVQGGGTYNGANIRTAEDIGELYQLWDIVGRPEKNLQQDGYYWLFNVNSGRTAEVAYWSLDNGGNIWQYGTGDNDLQAWSIENADNGYFYIRNEFSTKYMTDTGSNVYQWEYTGDYNQQWQFIPANPAVSGSLTAHYEFEGDANDSAGSNHGTITGSVTYPTGPFGQAIDLDGSNDYVTLPAGIADTDDITIAAWVYWDGGNQWQRIFDFGNDTTEYMFLSPRSADDTLRFAITNSGNGEEQILDTDQLPTGQWVHIAVTLSGNTAIMYIDGAPRVAAQIRLDPSDFNPVNNYIGESQWTDPRFNGRIDEFRIYDFALTAEDIATLAGGDANHPPFFTEDPIFGGDAFENMPFSGLSLADYVYDLDGDEITFSKISGPDWLIVAPDGELSGMPVAADLGENSFTVRATDSSYAYNEATLNITVIRAGLNTYYKFDGDANDCIGSKHGTVTETVTYPAGQINEAIELDGTEDYVTLPADLVNSDDMTISVWVRWDGGGLHHRIFDFGNDTAEYMYLTPRSDGSELRFVIMDSDVGGEQILSTASLPTGQFRHVAVTLEGDVGKLYVNGSLADTNPDMTVNPSDFDPAVNYLGKSQSGDDPLYDGLIDDLRIYNFALTEDDIATLAEGNTNNPPSFVSDPFINDEAIEDSPYSGLSLPAFAYDLDGDSLVFGKFLGADWLTVAPDGSLSGTPPDAETGWKIFGVTAEDTGGLESDAAMVIYVNNIFSGINGFEDLEGLTQNWLSAGCTDTPACGGADLDGDKDVDFFDYVILVDNWPTE